MYNKDVFALPGRTSDTLSSGCNRLIFDNKATLIDSAENYVRSMNWDTLKMKKNQPKQRELFLNLTDEEQAIFDILSATESVHVNALSVKADISISSLFPTLLEMEMKNIIEPLPGGLYKLK